MNNKLNGLELSLVMGCRINCDYCPQKLLLGKYYAQDRSRTRKLSFENFKIVLDKIQPGATLSFGGMCEPFHNESCTDMIVYADERGHKICLDTTLDGMSILDFEKIKNIKFEEVILHIPDKENHSKFVITDEYLKLFKLVSENLNIIQYSCHGTIHDAVYDKVDKKIYLSQTMGDRAGNLEIESVRSTNITGKIICYHGLRLQPGTWLPVMLPDGSLVLCCNDYGMKHVLGNLIHQSWDEIREGEEYKKIINGWNDDAIDILCRNCSAAKKVETLPAMRLKDAVDKRKAGKRFENIRKETMDLVDRFIAADHICVFGLGKLWRDHFYQEYWHEGLGVTVFSDNNPELQETSVNGMKCIRPAELKNYKNLLVVLFVKNGDAIISQLNTLGITNYVMIDELYGKCNKL